MAAPERRRPGRESPIRLTPNVEKVNTNSSAPVAEQTPTPVAPAAEVSPPAQTQPAPVSSKDTREAADSAPTKTSTTVSIRTDLKKRAETAVLRTGGYEDGYSSFVALLEGALERELLRLEQTHNNGEPFPPNHGAFRRGRPLGG